MSDSKKHFTNRRRKQIRLRDFDYSKPGKYFVTICCHDKQQLFGTVENHILVLNEYGSVAEKCWLEIPQHYPNVVLHEFIIMPNHVHGILEILDPNDSPVVGPQNHLSVGPQNHLSVGPQNSEALQIPNKHQYQKIIPGSLGAIVRGFKIGVSKWFNRNTDIQRVWQSDFYEHIIRDDIAFREITMYIRTNPLRW